MKYEIMPISLWNNRHIYNPNIIALDIVNGPLSYNILSDFQYTLYGVSTRSFNKLFALHIITVKDSKKLESERLTWNNYIKNLDNVPDELATEELINKVVKDYIGKSQIKIDVDRSELFKEFVKNCPKTLQYIKVLKIIIKNSDYVLHLYVQKPKSYTEDMIQPLLNLLK